MAPWKARRVATDTRSLPLDGARWVDAQLADRANGFGLPTIDRMVALAAARYAPKQQEQNEQQSRAGWHVTLTHPRPGEFAGTSWLEAAGDTADLTAFHDLVCAEARLLGRLGDTDDYGVRQAKALGVIAARQATLDLPRRRHDAGPDTVDGPGVEAAAAAGRQPTLFLHLSLADLTTHLTTGAPVIGEAERLGPVTTDQIRTWLTHSKATIRPVLDLTRTDAVDRHDPPTRMRQLVILRDGRCVFPWCGRTARTCDLDHIQPYDPDGPPGQTSPANLAPLCRRHHRAKTFTGWTYQRHHDGTYTWTSPHHRTYSVGPDGTHDTGPPETRPPRPESPAIQSACPQQQHLHPRHLTTRPPRSGRSHWHARTQRTARRASSPCAAGPRRRTVRRVVQPRRPRPHIRLYAGEPSPAEPGHVEQDRAHVGQRVAERTPAWQRARLPSRRG